MRASGLLLSLKTRKRSSLTFHFRLILIITATTKQHEHITMLDAAANQIHTETPRKAPFKIVRESSIAPVGVGVVEGGSVVVLDASGPLVVASAAVVTFVVVLAGELVGGFVLVVGCGVLYIEP
jgi:hypothetical protein